MEKGASASGNAYVWSHNLKNNDDEAIDPIDDITTDTVYTDENGKLVLNGLKDSEVHFLVETEAPEGYYLDTTPIQFQTNENTVIYKMIPNISRAVRLTKASSYDNEPVEGAEFVLYDNNNKPITGFTKTSLKIKDGAETTYYKYDVKGKAQLKTFANGQLNIHGLPAGDYYLQEKSPAPGFVMPENPPKYKFTLADEMTDKLKGNLYEENGFYYVLANPSADNKPKDVFNDEAVKSVMITKVGKESKPISGAAFKLQRFKGTEEEWKAQQSPAASKYQDVKVNEKDSVYFKTKAKEEAKGGYEVDANGRLTFTDLPSGHYALKETKAPEDYELARNLWYFDVDVLNKDEVQISWNPDGKEPIEGNKIPNEFNNGTLKLHKIVSGTGGNTERKFNFDISLKDRYGDNYKGWLNYTISRQSEGGNEVEVESKRINMDEKYGGKLSLLLKHEQTLTITGISGGASYKIVEENLKLDGYNPNIDKPSGTIPNGQTVEVTARNRYMTGMLRLTKEVGGINGDKTNPFEFTLRFEDIWHGEVPWNGKRTFTVLRTEDDNQEEPKVETLEVIGGFANVKLKSGQSITIAGLPDGTMYEITETAVDDYITKVSLNANKIGEDGSDDVSTDKTLTVEDNKIGNLIEDNCRDNVLFTNTRVPDEGSLMITKYVDCLLGHHEQEFDFKVTLKDTNEKPISGIYKAKIGRYTDKDSNLKEEKPDVEEIGIEFNENGEAFFKLKHQEYLMFTNLPEDSHYKVEEIPADGYEISMGEAAEGKIKENSADTPPILVTVNNFHKEGNLKVSKLVSGRGADLQKEFDFKLTLTDAEGKPFGGTFPYAKTDMVQNSEQNTLAEEPEESVNTIIINEDGTADFKLKDGQEIKISGLPDGTNYQVEEVTTDDKYKVTVTDGSGTIQSNGTANVRFVNTYKTGQLNVKKVVANGETDKKFHFKVKLDDETISGTYNEMEFKNGIAEFDLAHNEIKIASNLPVDIKYTVTEDSYAGYAVTYTGETGTISDTSHSEAVITNTQISSNPPDNPPTPPGDNPPTPPGGDPPTPPGGNPPNPPGENPPNPPGETPPTSPGDNPTTSPGNPTTPPAKEPQLKPPKEPSVNQNSPKDTESKSPEVLRQKLKSVKAAINRIKTGDVTNPWPPLVLMIISLCCIVAVLMRKWKRK